ncbi:DEAD/DEAH box helicase family protein [Microbulbifer agarilyticus]|uniref:DEAD/DEAH box helicase family protein n=1 Tax=Microbulbifer agarilyticus TaxID=260552 RepID=UPI001CD2DB92|nr:DEAD/DEAH box helicase family protein [Microbulbifer agarilyticus]MCA0893286.1 DEAD/DEAH box helicase family protein [Microbulbifer agarilyticus]
MQSQFLNPQRLQLGPWQAFERIIARYLEHGGFKDVTVVGGPDDRGADIVGTFRGKNWLVQTKFRTNKSVGKEAIQEAMSAQWDYDADVIVVVSNSGFSNSAKTLWRELKSKGFDIRLWDQDFLLDQANNLNDFSSSRRSLRNYQKDAVSALKSSEVSDRKKGLVTLATGLGKTVVASSFISDYLERNPQSNILFLAHISELVRQLDRSCWAQLSKYSETHLWTDGEKPSYANGVTFATWQSISYAISHGEPLESVFDVVVVDECHHAASSSYKEVIHQLAPKYLLGITATPWRGDGESLRPLFGDPVFSMDIVQGMQEGYLAKVDYQMMVDGIDWEEIRQLSLQGLTVKDLNKALYVPERDLGMIESIVETIESTENPRTLVFCRSIEHARRIQNFFRQFDISAGIIHSQLHRSDRFKSLSSFRIGKIKVLISIEMLNEGIDVPEVNIVVFARVTHSRRIFLQQLGRGLRLSENKSHVTVLDYVADVRRIAAAVEMNSHASSYKEKEEVNYPDGEIVKFSKYSQDFFHEYLADMADISDLDEDAQLSFPS